MNEFTQINPSFHIPTFIGEVVKFIAILTAFPFFILVSSGNVLGTAILIVVVLPTLLVARSYRDTVEFDFERAQIIVTRSLLWYFVLHTKVYTFRDLLSMKYSLDADFWGTITMSFADGTTQVIQPFPYAKETFEFLRTKISRSQ